MRIRAKIIEFQVSRKIQLASKKKPPVELHKDLEVLTLPDFDSWYSWLELNHEQFDGIWLKFAKKASGIQSVTYVEAREAAIIFGWIDGLINRYDGRYYLTKFTQRRKRSQWSKINREIANQLIQEKRMMSYGLAEVQAARRDGRWERAYDSQATIRVPTELSKELENDENAKRFFESITKSERYAFLYRIVNAKRSETKQRHIDRTMQMLRNETTYRTELRKKK